MKARSVALAALPAVVVALALVACGTKVVVAPTRPSSVPAASPASSPASSPIPPSPSADGFVSAVIGTESIGSALLSVDLMTRVGSTERVLHGRGGSDLAAGLGDFTWTGGAGATRELVTDRWILVQVSPPDGRWLRLPASGVDAGSTPTSGAADPLRRLESLGGVAVDGTEILAGQATTRYRGSLRADPSDLRAMGLTDEELDGLGDAVRDARIDVTVWLDASEHVVRVDRLLRLADGEAASAFMSTSLSDFGTMLDLTAPPSDLVDDAPEGQ